MRGTGDDILVNVRLTDTTTGKELVNGQTVSGNITWQVVMGSANVGRVDFAIDGTVKWSEHVAPWLYNGVPRGLKTTALSNGAHTLTATAYSKNGRSTGTST